MAAQEVDFIIIIIITGEDWQRRSNVSLVLSQQIGAKNKFRLENNQIFDRLKNNVLRNILISNSTKP